MIYPTIQELTKGAACNQNYAHECADTQLICQVLHEVFLFLCHNLKILGVSKIVGVAGIEPATLTDLAR